MNVMVSVITTALIGAVFFLCAKLFPVSPSLQAQVNMEELKKKYMKEDFLQMGVFFLIVVLSTFGLYFLCKAVLLLQFSGFPKDAIVVQPPVAMIFIVAFSGALLLGSLGASLFQKWRLKEQWYEFIAYSNLKYNFDVTAVFRYLMMGYTLLVGMLILLTLNWYSIFAQNDIKISGLFGIGVRAYKYSAITQIKEIEKLKTAEGEIEEPYFIVVFADGYEWNSRQAGFDNYEEDHDIIDLIMQKTGKELEIFEFNTKK